MIKYANANKIKPQVLKKITRVIQDLDRRSPCLSIVRRVLLVDAMSIEVNGKTGFACVVAMKSGKADLVLSARYERHPEISYRDWLSDMLPHLIAHEWVHLEQVRDRQRLSERGVEVRARNLSKKCV